MQVQATQTPKYTDTLCKSNERKNNSLIIYINLCIFRKKLFIDLMSFIWYKNNKKKNYALIIQSTIKKKKKSKERERERGRGDFKKTRGT